MKPTNQTKFSLFFADGKRLTYGNCLVACVASFLDESIEEVPNIYTFYGMEDRKGETLEDPMWMRVLNLWMEKKHKKKISINSRETPAKEEYVIMRGKSLRGRPHCCIYKKEGEGLVPFFDPHPTSQFLKEEDYYYSIEKI
jgi:hypothetical protein